MEFGFLQTVSDKAECNLKLF